MKSKRVEILFEDKEYRELERAAKKRQQSVGHVVREAVAKYVTDADRKRRREAVEWMARQRGPVGSPEEIKKAITDAQFEAIVRSLGGGEPDLP